MKLTNAFTEDFEAWLGEKNITIAEFKEWYAKEYIGVAIGAIRRHQGRMNKLADDDRIHPNKRFTATYQSAYWTAKLQGDKKEQSMIAAILLGDVLNKIRIDRILSKAQNQEPATNIEQDATDQIKNAFADVYEDLQDGGFLGAN